MNDIERREGKVIAQVAKGQQVLKITAPLSAEVITIDTHEQYYKALLNTEMYLNDTVATEIMQKFGIAIRFHL